MRDMLQKIDESLWTILPTCPAPTPMIQSAPFFCRCLLLIRTYSEKELPGKDTTTCDSYSKLTDHYSSSKESESQPFPFLLETLLLYPLIKSNPTILSSFTTFVLVRRVWILVGVHLLSKVCQRSKFFEYDNWRGVGFWVFRYSWYHMPFLWNHLS